MYGRMAMEAFNTSRPYVLRASPKEWGVLALGTLLLSGLMWAVAPHREITPALRGAEIAQRMGCFGCHGPSGAGRVGDSSSPGGSVPGWDSRTATMYLKSVDEIREWILFGRPRAHAAEQKAAHKDALIPMPAYEGLLSRSELDDLVQYFIAVSGWSPETPDAAYEGNKIARREGCFGCHGPSGMGGVQNPGSFKGYIPPWQGDEFAELVHDTQELRGWILDGKIQRLWDNPAARHYLEAQIIKMPPYRKQLSEQELDQLVAYIDWLRRPR